MRSFFRLRTPRFDRVLLVESGSRQLVENFMPALARAYNPSVAYDLVTCYPGEPRGFSTATGRVWRVGDYRGRAARKRLYSELAARNYSFATIICSGEIIMSKWKWALAARLPVKILILNENGDYFWFDRSNWRTIVYFAMYRAGLTGVGAVRTLAGFVVFPFTLVYLILYTAFVHIRRKARLWMPSS